MQQEFFWLLGSEIKMITFSFHSLYVASSAQEYERRDECERGTERLERAVLAKSVNEERLHQFKNDRHPEPDRGDTEEHYAYGYEQHYGRFLLYNFRKCDSNDRRRGYESDHKDSGLQ